MSGIETNWMRQITDIHANKDTITVVFNKGSETYPEEAYATIIRDSCMLNIPIRNSAVGDKLVEVFI
jgi:hypothetical protein